MAKNKISEKIQHKTLRTLSVLIGFSEALVIYMASTYFQKMSGFQEVGVFYVGTYVIFLAVLFNLHKLVRLVGKTSVLKMTFIGQIATTVILLAVPSPIVKLICMMLFLMFDQLLLVNLDILLESFSSDESSGRTRGSHLTVLNLGFILGPFLSTRILDHYGFAALFSLVLILKLIALSLSILRLGSINHAFTERETVGKLIKKAWKHKDIRRIYYVSYALESFYALMIMFSPIYLRSIGMDLKTIGIIFTVMLLPFLFFEYPIGWLADKELGEKEMIIFFLSWTALATSWVYTLDRPNAWLWGLALLTTRIGAASLQILRDSYFYKKIDGKDVDLIDFYRTAGPVAYIVAAGLSSLVVYYFGVRQVFLLASLILITALWSAWRLKDNLSERERLSLKHHLKRI